MESPSHEVADGTVERWAHDYVTTRLLDHKLAPPALPERWQSPVPAPICIDRPGRPAALQVVEGSPRTPGSGALRGAEPRARLLHTFLHHELQAAELMCRTVLAHPQAPMALKRGLISICLDEIRHMGMYNAHMAVLGHGFGDFPVNDWFWKRLPADCSLGGFFALMGLGFEGGNLDHARRFADLFRQAGDEAGAVLQERVCEEEIPHVAFAAHWFQQLEGELSFERWRAALPAPLSPMVMRGHPLNLRDRRRAGYPKAFLEKLQAWRPDEPGS